MKAPKEEKQGFEVKLMQHIVKELINRIGKRRGSRDDIMRTIELVLGSIGPQKQGMES